MATRRINRSPRAHQGQFRILEVVFAAIIITTGYSIATFIMAPANTPVIRGKAELETLGANLLNQLASQGTFERTVTSGRANWEQELKLALTRLMPPATYFNMTLFNATFTQPSVLLQQLNSIPITNVQTAEALVAFARSPEVVAVTQLYTSSKGWLIVVRITIAPAGGVST